MNECVLATANPGKIIELQTLLAPLHCRPQTDFGIHNAEETGLSFIENAILKARHASRLAKKPALADDSGLVVPALQGAPGIYSARFAKKNATDLENIAYLLKKLEHITDRYAYFYCALAWIQHPDDPTPIIATGQWIGEIARAPAGEQGFGYDPVFYLKTQGKTAAQLPKHIKNNLSHRAQALQTLRHQRQTVHLL